MLPGLHQQWSTPVPQGDNVFHTPNEAIAKALRASTGLYHRYVDDLKPIEWHSQPVAGVNSVAWIVGHLTLVEHRRAVALGAVDLPTLPDGFAERYGATRQAAGTQAGLDTAADLTKLFLEVRDKLIAAVLATTVSKLAEPLATPHPLFGDQAEAAQFMALHTSLHLGQITVVRRLLGYPPVA